MHEDGRAILKRGTMKKILVVMAGLAEKEVAAIAGEISGETAKRNLGGIARFHRQRGSRGFHKAAELVAERLRA